MLERNLRRVCERAGSGLLVVERKGIFPDEGTYFALTGTEYWKKKFWTV